MPSKKWQEPILGQGKKNGKEKAYTKGTVEENKAIRAAREEEIELMVLSLRKIREHGRKNRFDMMWCVKKNSTANSLEESLD